MLSKHSTIQRVRLEMVTLDQQVTANHLVRKIEAITLSFMRKTIELKEG